MIIVGVIVVGLLALVLLSKSFKNNFAGQIRTGNDSNKSVGDAVADTVKGTLQEILRTGKNVKCSFSQTNEDGKIESITYISGNKFRTESKATDSDNKITESNLISDGEWAYMWGSEQEVGTKMKFSEFQKPDNSNANPGTYKGNAEFMKNYNYNCTPWIPDSSKFKVPANIEFQDLTEMMKGFEDSAKKMTKELCESCDKLDTAEQITACKANLKCDQ
jgi:hypothetical protein